MTAEIIKKDGKCFVMLPLKQYEKMLHDLEMLDDIRAFDKAKQENQEHFPAELIRRLCAGENAIKLFRTHRGMTQLTLAKKANTTREYISQLENNLRKGTIETLKKIAAALGVELEDLS